MRPGDRVGPFLLAGARDDLRLDVPHREIPRRRQQPLAEGLSVFRSVAVEQRLRIGDDLLGRDPEQIARTLADVGVSNVAVGRDQALIDDTRDRRGQRSEPLAGRLLLLLASVLRDRQSGQGRYRIHHDAVIGARLAGVGAVPDYGAQEVGVRALDWARPTGAKAAAKSEPRKLCPLRIRLDVLQDDRLTAPHGKVPGAGLTVERYAADGPNVPFG